MACVHAGWRGAINGIVENTLKQIIKINKNNDIYVAIGPCIGLKNYEVDKKFYNEFFRKDKTTEKFFFFINFKVTKFDVNYVENIELDTYEEKEKFFSFRRSRKLGEKDYGRCISTIGLSDI